MRIIFIILVLVSSCFVVFQIARSQGLQTAIQTAQNQIASDNSQINQINQDEATLNQQYTSDYSSKEDEKNILEQDMHNQNSSINYLESLSP